MNGWLDNLPPQVDCLRDYQAEQVGHVADAMRQGFQRILVQGVTGSGKTHVIATIVLAAFLAGLRVLILATRRRRRMAESKPKTVTSKCWRGGVARTYVASRPELLPALKEVTETQWGRWLGFQGTEAELIAAGVA